MENKHNLLGVLKTLFKWKKQILIVCGVAAIGSIIISLLLPTYYQSTTVFLAASPDQAKPELMFGSGQLAAEYYGNENDIDRIMTIAESNELVDFLVDSFNLYEHYDINPESTKAAFKVNKNFFKLYEVQKTKRDAIELSYEDTDKELAAEIVNTARNRINQIAQNLLKESLQKKIQTYQDNIQNKNSLLASVGDTLIQLRKKYSIYSVEAQSEALTTQLSEAESKLIRNQVRLEALKESPSVPKDTITLIAAMVRGMDVEVSKLAEKVDTFNAGLGTVSAFEREYQEANQSLSENKEMLKQLNATYNSNIPTILLVEKGQIPVIKSRPKRSLIVIGAVAAAFFFSIIGVLLIENYRDVNWREIYNAK